MSLIAITLALRLAASAEAPEGRPPGPVVSVLPGRDAGITPYAKWSNHENKLHVTGVAGAELFIEEALMIEIKGDVAHALLSAERITAPGVGAFGLEVWAGDRIAGRLDLLHASPTLPLGPLEDGTVLGVGLRLKLAEDAQGGRDIALSLHVTG